MSRAAGYVYLAMASSIWGGTYVVSKVVLGIVPSLELVWLRYVVALVALVGVGLVQGVRWQIRRKDVSLFVAISLIGYVISISAQFIGTKLSTAQLGAVITSSAPAFMVIFGFILLRERITWQKLVSVLLASVGVVFIVGIGDVSASVRIGGVVLALAAVTWALMSVMVKKISSDIPALVFTTYVILVATVVMTPFAFIQNASMNWSKLAAWPVWSGILYLGAVSTAIAFLFWNKGLQLTEVSKGSLFFFLQPVVGTVLGWLLLGEHVGEGFWLGFTCIAVGVLLVVAPKKAQS